MGIVRIADEVGSEITVDCETIEEAVDEWCKAQEAKAGFAEGYPNGLWMTATHDDGSITRCRVSTDFDPVFYVHDESHEPIDEDTTDEMG